MTIPANEFPTPADTRDEFECYWFRKGEGRPDGETTMVAWQWSNETILKFLQPVVGEYRVWIEQSKSALRP